MTLHRCFGKHHCALAVLLVMGMLALSACGGAGGDATSAAAQTPAPAPASAEPPVTQAPADEPIDNSQTGIGVVYQQYEDGDIAEILTIRYDGQQKALERHGGKNPEIELINSAIKDEIVAIYEGYRDGLLEEYYPDSIEIRSYPFVDGQYVQIVTTCIMFPEIVPDLFTKLWSFNFDKEANAYVGVDEMLARYGLTNEGITQKVQDWHTDENETVIEVKATGFLAVGAPATPVTHFLLEITAECESDPFKYFVMYTPESDEVEALRHDRLLDPAVYDMAAMEEPLACTRDDLLWYSDSEYALDMDTEGMDELTPGAEYMLDGMLYVNLQCFPPVADAMYDEDTLRARIAELEGDDIRVISLALSQEHSERLTYPAWLIVYETGTNEDTSVCTDLYFQTDTNEYRAHISVPADWEEDYHDEVANRLATVYLLSAGE